MFEELSTPYRFVLIVEGIEVTEALAVLKSVPITDGFSSDMFILLMELITSLQNENIGASLTDSVIINLVSKVMMGNKQG
ncbi:Uncharacterized protein TCM_033043 [Theobroma cacao]|uniref:Uncharacterized protein n=1 Tax=Theobroma cacao TaxID=3641 RepID=A0A061F9I3_THECC|nr:Uncharacterized protein TCM_033043 [Theobroma cacao]